MAKNNYLGSNRNSSKQPTARNVSLFVLMSFFIPKPAVVVPWRGIMKKLST